jgi:hypothetical protein
MIIVEEDYIKENKAFRINHLDLSEPCLERGGNSTVHKGVLAQYLNTNIPYKTKPWIDLCHACHNEKCSNPKHLYWGTRSENIQDSKDNGTWKSGWEKLVEKYGLEEARRMNSRKMLGNTFAEKLKGKPSNNKKGINQYSK